MLRFNFRGVRLSAGTFGKGAGGGSWAALDYMSTKNPGAVVVRRVLVRRMGGA